MIKKANKNIHWPVLVLKNHTLTCISIKKNIHWPVLMIKNINKKYTLTCINDKKGQ